MVLFAAGRGLGFLDELLAWLQLLGMGRWRGAWGPSGLRAGMGWSHPPPGPGDQVGQQPGPPSRLSACCLPTHPGLLGARPSKVEKPVQAGGRVPMMAPFHGGQAREGGPHRSGSIMHKPSKRARPGTGLQDRVRELQAQQGAPGGGQSGRHWLPLPSHSPGCEVWSPLCHTLLRDGLLAWV